MGRYCKAAIDVDEGEFAAAAMKLAGQAGLLFGWRPAEFWNATPAELGAVVSAMSRDVVGTDDVERLRLMLGEERDG